MTRLLSVTQYRRARVMRPSYATKKLSTMSHVKMVSSARLMKKEEIEGHQGRSPREGKRLQLV